MDRARKSRSWAQVLLWLGLGGGLGLALVGGVGYWLSTYQLAKSGPSLEIQVTALPNLVSQDLIDRYQSRSGHRIKLKPVSSPLEIWRRLERPNPDGSLELTTVFSWQTEAAGPLGRIRPFDISRPSCQRLLDRVAVDFRQVPGRSFSNGTWLFAWAASGFWAPPSSTGWTDGFSLDRELRSGRRDVILLPWAAELFWLAVRGQPLALLEEGETDEAESRALATTGRALRDLERQAVILGRSEISPWFGRPDRLLRPELLTKNKLVQGHHTGALFPPFREDWRFILPQEKGHLWTVGFAMRETLASAAEIDVMNDVACDFLGAVADQWTEKAWSQVFEEMGLASTLRAHEREDWPPVLRPSWLRQLPMRSIEFRRPFAADAVVHDLLMQGDSGPRPKSESPGSSSD